MTDELRMGAYYYGFAKTDSRVVDKVLSAVACAGKAFHHTSEWNDDANCPGHVGDTPVDWIQNAADEAARELERYHEALQKIAGLTMSMCLSVGDLAQRQKDIAFEALGVRHD
jgi:hypothetical protein